MVGAVSKIRNLMKNVVHFILRIRPTSANAEAARCPVNGMTMEEYRKGSRPASYK
jgi:hypothetical protein